MPFRLYRDYDGAGGRFGETGLQAVTTDQTQLAIYAAQRSSDGAVTLVVLNKTAAAIESTFTLANYQGRGSAAVYLYSGANLAKILSQGSVAFSGGTLSYGFPAYSATVVVLGP